MDKKQLVRFSPKAFGGRGRMKEVTCGGNALRFYAAGEAFSCREAAELFLAKNRRICDKLVMDRKRLHL
ncbi:hypothetical protein P8452_66364 [Trifolium repens]|nr:hypothetical protein P8452_66364 [Trifolium repens]